MTKVILNRLTESQLLIVTSFAHKQRLTYTVIHEEKEVTASNGYDPKFRNGNVAPIERVRQFVISTGMQGTVHSEVVEATGWDNAGNALSSLCKKEELQRIGKGKPYRYYDSKLTIK